MKLHLDNDSGLVRQCSRTGYSFLGALYRCHLKMLEIWLSEVVYRFAGVTQHSLCSFIDPVFGVSDAANSFGNKVSSTMVEP